jgi:hypothetical protein
MSTLRIAADGCLEASLTGVPTEELNALVATVQANTMAASVSRAGITLRVRPRSNVNTEKALQKLMTAIARAIEHKIEHAEVDDRSQSASSRKKRTQQYVNTSGSTRTR